jgi:diguanylate cyclase (GGDEF)-like protein
MSSVAATPTKKKHLRFSAALMAVGFLGLLELGFFAFASVHELSHQFLLLESAVILAVTLGLLFLVARQDKKTEEAEAIAESQLSHLADFATDLYWETDLEGHVIAAGGRLMKTFFPDMNHVLGKHYMSVIKLDETEREKMLTALRAIKPYSDILSVFTSTDDKRYYISLSATPRYSKTGAVIGYLGVGTNVTRRIEAQGRLKHMAEHDMLTGLANRYSFQNRIEKDVAKSAEDENVAILAIDLDNFKSINDTFGHQTGDALLNLVAKRLRKVVRGKDWAARLGGDEFVVVSREVANPMDACLVAARIVSALSRPFRLGELELKCSASVGVACAPLHADSTQSLLKCADLALYEAKGSGRSCYRLFQPPAPRRVAVN